MQFIYIRHIQKCVVATNEVALHRARLVLRWVTVCGIHCLGM